MGTINYVRWANKLNTASGGQKCHGDPRRKYPVMSHFYTKGWKPPDYVPEIINWLRASK